MHEIALNLQQAAAEPPGAAPVLDEPSFLAELARERRRADRTGADMAMHVVRLQPARPRPEAESADLADLLTSHCRRTDVVGRLDDGAVAVLLPDTGQAGARSFEAKVFAEADAEAGCLATATGFYPGVLFERLAEGSPALRDDLFQRVCTLAEPPPRPYALKRAFDIAGATLLLVLLAPLMLATALAIRVSSRGPVIYRQHRIGQDAQRFTFYKFRSMDAASDDSIHRAFTATLIKGGATGEAARVYKIKRDPRVTGVGRFIRKTSIDELPQLFNVLFGRMSLVGPRPPLPYEAENYSAWHMRRIAALKPGITGAWQVNGRSKVSFDEMVRMDLRYARDCSLWLDLKIIAKTVFVVLRCEGAS